MVLDQYRDRWHELCLQCGYRNELPAMARAQKRIKMKEEVGKNA
jgi:hypothetical protein